MFAPVRLVLSKLHGGGPTSLSKLVIPGPNFQLSTQGTVPCVIPHVPATLTPRDPNLVSKQGKVERTSSKGVVKQWQKEREREKKRSQRSNLPVASALNTSTHTSSTCYLMIWMPKCIA